MKDKLISDSSELDEFIEKQESIDGDPFGTPGTGWLKIRREVLPDDPFYSAVWNHDLRYSIIPETWEAPTNEDRVKTDTLFLAQMLAVAIDRKSFWLMFRAWRWHKYAVIYRRWKYGV